MNSYEQKASEYIAGALNYHQLAEIIGKNAADRLVGDLTALFKEETRKSFLNGLKKANQKPAAKSNRQPAALRSGLLQRPEPELALEAS